MSMKSPTAISRMQGGVMSQRTSLLCDQACEDRECEWVHLLWWWPQGGALERGGQGHELRRVLVAGYCDLSPCACGTTQEVTGGHFPFVVDYKGRMAR